MNPKIKQPSGKFTSVRTKVCRDVASAIQKEWKEENSLGGYASSTILCAHTKRDHGLLVVPWGKPDSHAVLLSNLEETLHVGDKSFPLSTHLYSDTIYPKGYEHLENFYLAPNPIWIYRIDQWALMKAIVMIPDEHTVFIRYQFLSSYGDYVRLELRPVVAFRQTSQLNRENQSHVPAAAFGRHHVYFKPQKSFPELFLYHNAAVTDRSERWFRHLNYPEDKRQGVGGHEEDLYSPCSMTYAFLKEEGVFLCATTQAKSGPQSGSLKA